MPHTLDETYARILRGIDEEIVEDARRILILLCFALRPLTLHEVIDAIAVESTGLNLQRRLQDADDICEICPGLIDVSIEWRRTIPLHSSSPSNSQSGSETSVSRPASERSVELTGDIELEEGFEPESDDKLAQDVQSEGDVEAMEYDSQIEDEHDRRWEELVTVLRIAHFSVQEYLESNRIHEQNSVRFAIKCPEAHTDIGRLCLIYLQEPALSKGKLDEVKLKEFPLAHYAATYWIDHYRASDRTSSLDPLVLELFQNRRTCLTWASIHGAEHPNPSMMRHQLKISDIGPTVYYLSLLGLTGPLQTLMYKHSESADEITDVVNANGGFYGSALQAASFSGYDEVVQVLLDAKADVNANGGYRGCALLVASENGHEKIVQMLLDAKADLNIEGSVWPSAIESALLHYQYKAVQMLLVAGARVPSTDSFQLYELLKVASESGNEKAVQILLEKGVMVNANDVGGDDGPLQLAAYFGHTKIVQMLMDAGANVNARGGTLVCPLKAAQGNREIEEILLAAGAVDRKHPIWG